MRRDSIRFVRVALPATLALALLGATAGCQQHGAHAGSAGAADTLMLMPQNATGGVGTVRRTELLIAYHRSARHAETLRSLIRRRDEAAQAGDADTVAALEHYGAAMQDVAHRQLAGKEPLYTVLLGVEDELRAVMDRHGLARVVEAKRGVEGLDITDELIAMLPEAQ